MATATTNGRTGLPGLGTELGRSGLLAPGGYLADEHLRELQGAKWPKIVKAMQDHPIVAGILFGIDMLCRQVAWRWEPADPSPDAAARAVFLDECWADMEYTWPDTLSVMLSMVPWGFALLEPVYKFRHGESLDPLHASRFTDGLVGVRKLALRAQESIVRWQFDDHGQVTGAYQWAPPTYQQTLLPLDRLLHFRTSVAKDNPQGKSVLRGCYTGWYYATNLQRIEAIGAERDLAGVPKITAPAELFSATRTADQQAIWDALTTMGALLKQDEQTYLLIPSDTADGKTRLYDVELLRSAGTKQFDCDTIIQRYHSDIAASLLADFIRLGHENVGGYAISQDKTELFSKALGAWLDNIGATVSNQLAPRLMRLNGWPAAQAPRLCHEDIEATSLTGLATDLAALADKGLLTPDPQLEAWLRKQAGAPPLPEGLEPADRGTAPADDAPPPAVD